MQRGLAFILMLLLGTTAAWAEDDDGAPMQPSAAAGQALYASVAKDPEQRPASIAGLRGKPDDTAARCAFVAWQAGWVLYGLPD